MEQQRKKGLSGFLFSFLAPPISLVSYLRDKDLPDKRVFAFMSEGRTTICLVVH